MRGIIHHIMWKIRKFQYTWKVHIISTFFHSQQDWLISLSIIISDRYLSKVSLVHWLSSAGDPPLAYPLGQPLSCFIKVEPLDLLHPQPSEPIASESVPSKPLQEMWTLQWPIKFSQLTDETTATCSYIRKALKISKSTNKSTMK